MQAEREFGAVAEGAVGEGSGGVEEIGSARGRTWRSPDRQAEVAEDRRDHGGVKDSRDDGQGAAAFRALLDVDLEYPFDQPAPAQAHRRHGRGRLGVVG